MAGKSGPSVGQVWAENSSCIRNDTVVRILFAFPSVRAGESFCISKSLLHFFGCELWMSFSLGCYSSMTSRS